MATVFSTIDYSFILDWDTPKQGGGSEVSITQYCYETVHGYVI